MFIHFDSSNSASSIKYFLITIFTVFFLAPLPAASNNVVVSTPQNTALTVNLSFTHNDLNNPTLVLNNNAAHGAATTIACRNGAELCISYTPEPDYVGFETLDYIVNHDDGEAIVGSVSIKVGDANTNNQGIAPSQVVDDTLDNICLSQENSEIVDLCESFSAATNSSDLDDLRELLNAITPQDIAAFDTLSSDIASQQLANINRRLSTLRKLQLRNNSFAFNHQNLFRNNFEQDPFSNISWFASADAGTGNQDETDLEDGYEYGSYGLTLGADKRFGNKMIVGAAAGTTQTQSEILHNGGELDVSSHNFIVYNTLFISANFFVDAIASFHKTSFDMSRHILFGTTDAYAESQSEGQSQNFSVGLGYDKSFGNGWSSSFTARWNLQRSTIGEVTETGADPFNLFIEERKVQSSQLNLGTQAIYAKSTSWGVVLPQFNIEALYSTSSSDDKIEGYFLVDKSKNQFSFEVNPVDQLYYKASIGSSFVFKSGKMAYVQLSRTIQRENLSAWNISIGGRMEF